MLNLKHPKVQFIILLSILFVITMFHLPITISLSLLILCVGGAAVFDILFAKIKKQELRVPYSGIITGLILTLIIDPAASWYQVITIVFAAIAIKDFLRISDRHIFNPAASGLMIGFLLFGLNPSWWGASPYTPGKITLSNLLVLLSALSLAYVSCLRFRRYYTVISFLVIFTLLRPMLLSSSLSSSISTVFSPGTLFYALVMLPEPMTSPVKKSSQIMYGIFVAVVSLGLVYLISNGALSGVSNFPDTSIIALLLGNLFFFKFR